MFKDEKVTYFGLWQDETADFYRKRYALDIICEACQRTIDEDIREQEAYQAMLYLEAHTTRPAVIRRLRKALDIEQPHERFEQVMGQLGRVVRHFCS